MTTEASEMPPRASVNTGIGTGETVANRPSYVDVHPQSGEAPDAMPEVLRELTLLRGSAISLEQKVNEILGRLDPLRRRVPTPMVEEREKAAAVRSSFPEPVSALGHDIRRVADQLSTLSDHVVRCDYELGL